MPTKKILIIGSGGRVGMQIAAELMRLNFDLAMVDIMDEQLLRQKAGRLLNDSRLTLTGSTSKLSIHGGVDALDTAAVTEIIGLENPDLVINYAIPITWDAAKRLPNYRNISAAGLGAFTPLQVLTPLSVGRAIANAGVNTRYMVGNLPDITIPIITGIARQGGVQSPLCGAGNVGLNQVAFRSQLALETGVSFSDIELSLVAHHVHWVAPREPGYSNEAPFMARVCVHGEDISGRFEDLRAVMNQGVNNHYEADASFSSTTGILASRVAIALLDDSDKAHYLHAPAPNGLPGGYPIRIQQGAVDVVLPGDWQLADAITAMEQAHTLDGVQAIDSDGTVRFTDYAQEILRKETGFELPATMPPSDIEATALEQISVMRKHFDALYS